ncbi:MAG TPA: hypothetical protein VK837_01495 [Longimicrobiales bacterium]|nr:hypothetical protein [Longimicrobiales bacterium]
MSKHATALALAAALGVLGCGDDTLGTGIDGGANVAIRLQTAAAGSPRVSLAGGGAALAIAGTNGTLRIDDLRLVVAEFELKRQDDDDCDVLTGPAHEACEKFDAGPFFIDVPLDGGGTIVVSTVVAADTYRRIDFEVEDLEDDGDAAEAARIEAVLAEIRTEFPEWPRKASMLAVGEFEPADGSTGRPFRVFFEAEIEVERSLEPPMVVGGDDAQRTISVELVPALWFTLSDGSVMDLSAFDGSLLEFEVEMERGFTSVEFD